MFGQAVLLGFGFISMFIGIRVFPLIDTKSYVRTRLSISFFFLFMAMMLVSAGILM